MKTTRRLALTLAACTAAALASGAALAQSYPIKPVTLVVAYPPGGDTDAMARLYADKLSQRLGQPVIVENRPGAGGTVGNSFVGRAAADGHTLLFTPNPFTLAPMVMNLPPSASYDVLNGFEPVILSSLQSVLLVAHPSAGIKTVADLVNQSKTGKPLSYGSPGAGSPMHVAAEQLNRLSGAKAQHIAYRGVGPVVNDVLAGHVPLGYVTLGPVAQHIEAGRLIAVALTDGRRSPLLPKVPTIAEQGYAIDMGAWHGIFAPKHTPAAVVHTLNTHMNDILKMKDVQDKLAAFGAVPVGGKPDALAKINADDYQRLTRLVKDLDIRAE